MPLPIPHNATNVRYWVPTNDSWQPVASYVIGNTTKPPPATSEEWVEVTEREYDIAVGRIATNAQVAESRAREAAAQARSQFAELPASERVAARLRGLGFADDEIDEVLR